MGAQPEAAPVPAFPVQDATVTPARLTSQAGPSQHQEGQTLQLDATLQCQVLEAALTGELGAMHPEEASPAMPCSSVPTQHEALGQSTHYVECRLAKVLRYHIRVGPCVICRLCKHQSPCNC